MMEVLYHCHLVTSTMIRRRNRDSDGNGNGEGDRDGEGDGGSLDVTTTTTTYKNQLNGGRRRLTAGVVHAWVGHFVTSINLP